MSGSRRFSDAEAREILRRATERGRGRPTLPPHGPGEGLTLAELQEIAAEAGIDPLAVRSAALARLPEPSRSAADLFRGGPALREHTLELPGHLPARRHADLAGALDRVFRVHGSTERAHGFRWSEDHTQGRTLVRVAERRDGGSEVQVRVDRQGWAAALNLAGLAVGLGLGAAAFAWGSAVAAVVAAPLGWWGVVGLVWRSYSRRLRDRVEAAVGEVVARLEEPG